MKFSIKKTFSRLLFVGLALIILGGWYNFTLAVDDDSSENNDKKGYTTLAPLPGTTQDCATDKNGEINCTTDLQTYLPGVFNLTIGIAGVLAVLMILIGGVEYITTDAIQGKHDGKQRINNALWGLVLVLVSWILLRTINPKLTVFDLTIKESVSSQSTDSADDSVNDNSSNSSINNSSNNSSDSSRQIQDSVSI